MRGLCILLLSIAVFCNLADVAPAYAAKKKAKSYRTEIKPGDQSFILLEAPYVCRRNGNKILGFGVVERKGGKTLFFNKVAYLKSRLGAGTTAQRKKTEVGIKKLQKKFKSLTNACLTSNPDDDDGDGIDDPDLPPGSIPDAESLAPLGRALTASDLSYLLEKAGYGGWDGSLASVLPQGVDALVNEFVRVKAEDPNLEILFESLKDDNTTQQLLPNIAGSRKAILALTLNSTNPLRIRLLHLLLRVFSLDGCRLSTGGSTTPGLNPRQDSVYWDYLGLLLAASKNPSIPDLVLNVNQSVAMLVSHGNAGSLADAPNENFAQELLDRMTIGATRLNESNNEVANYTRNTSDGTQRTDDLMLVAKALTGWNVQLVDPGIPNQRIWASLYGSDTHAEGPKVLFAGTPYQVSVDSDVDMIPALFRHPGAAQNWARILLEEFVTPNPPPGLVKALAQEIVNSGFHLEAPLAKLLKSRAFYYEGYKNTIAKNPIEIMVEATKLLNMSMLVNTQLNQLNSNIINSPWSDATNLGMGYDVACPPSPAFYPRWRFRESGAIQANLQFLGRLIDRGLDHATGATPVQKLWIVDNFLPGGSLTVPDLARAIGATFGVEVSPEQMERLTYIMDNVLNGSGMFEYRPYNNTLPGDLTLARTGKGMMLVLMLSSYPGFMLR